MMWVWWAAVVVPALVWLGFLLGTRRTIRAVPLLEDLDPPAPKRWPKVSVISPARDEVDKVEAAMQATLSSGYPALQVVAVDDRSTDGTGAKLDALASEDDRLRVVHVTETREGWLGKVAALDHGVRAALGEWLLFMDADVKLAPGALERIVAYAEAERLDYLTAYPSIEPAGLLVDACYAATGPVLGGAGRLWDVPNPDSDAFNGIGAFILFRRRFLARTEGLEWLRLEVADDMGLGLLAKKNGGRCGVLNARGFIHLPWYGSVFEMFDKLEKNWFAIVGRFEPARLAVIAALTFWWATSGLAVIWADGPVELASALVAPALMLLTTQLTSRWLGLGALHALLAPLGSVLFATMMMTANLRSALRGGIVWRGQLYRTEDLKPHQRVRV